MTDKLDNLILYNLDINSRQSAKEIAKKIRSNKDTVNYRICNLIKKKIITKFNTHIDTAKFGYMNIKTYIRFQDIDEEKEREFFSYLRTLPEVGWIAATSGRWDALFCVWASSTFSYHITLNKILNKFSKNIFEKRVVHNLSWYYYNRKWLNKKFVVYPIRYGGEPKIEKIKSKDLEILKELGKDAKTKVAEIAKIIHMHPQNVLNSIKAMERKGIITKYGIDIDYRYFGIVFCKAFIELHNIDTKTIENITNYCLNEEKIFALTTTLGSWDLEIEFEVNKVEEMHDIINRIKRTFPESIKGFDSVVIREQSEYNYVPVDK